MIRGKIFTDVKQHVEREVSVVLLMRDRVRFRFSFQTKFVSFA